MSQSTQSDADVAAQADAREVARVVAAEDAHVGGLYARLDQLRAQTAEQLAEVRRTEATGTHQNRFERDAFATLYEDRLSQLWSVENRLCFGRLDLREGTQDPRRYVGRLGLADERGRRSWSTGGRRRRRTSTRPPRPLHATSCDAVTC